MKRVLLCAVALLLTLAAVQVKPASACQINFCAACATRCASLGEYPVCNVCICNCVVPN
jgi:hypothetical protein